MRHTCRLFVALAAVALLACPASADVVIEGQKKVRRDSNVDFGPYAGYATWTYVVRRGDTLSEIAQHHLGTVKRQAEITELNPGLTSKTLIADRKILMPPKKTPRPLTADAAARLDLPADAKHWWDFYAARWHQYLPLERVVSGEAVPHHHYWSTLFAVRHDKLDEFERTMKRAEGRQNDAILKELMKKPWFAKAEQSLTGYTSLSELSPVASIVEHYRVEKIENGTIHMKRIREERFDKHRERVAGAGLFGGPWNLILLCMAFAGMLGLVIVVSRRRSPSRTEIPVGS